MSEAAGTLRRRAGAAAVVVVLDRTSTRCARKREPAAGALPFPTRRPMPASRPREASVLARSSVRRVVLGLGLGLAVVEVATAPAPVAAAAPLVVAAAFILGRLCRW